MNVLLIVMCLTLLIACDNGALNPTQRMQLLEFGTFRKLASQEDVSAPAAIAGALHAVSKVLLLERTTNVTARVGTSFGFHTKMPGKASGEVIRCTAKCIHPKMTDPTSGHSSEVEQWDTSGLAGQEGFIGYTFDNSWELVPGPWTIQVFMASELVIERTFNVRSPSKN